MPFPSPGDPSHPGIELRSPALQADCLPSEPPGNPEWEWYPQILLAREGVTLLGKGTVTPREFSPDKLRPCANLLFQVATHSSILAWKIPWTEEPGRLQSMGW